MAFVTSMSMVVSLVAVPSLPAHAAPAKPATSVKPACATQRPDAAAAAVTARLCNKRVQVTNGTTETDQVFVNPDGTTSVEHHFRPVRVQRNGAWTGVDATLARAADGSIAPKAAAVDLKLSGGGNAPLITSTVDGVTLALGSPVANLPAPTLSGNTATYADVLPGVDLQVIADIDGFAEHLVVKNRQAAAQPALKALRFATTTTGGTVKTADAGGVQVVDAKGQPAFAASTAEMWDNTEATGPDRLKAARDSRQAAPNVPRGRRAAMSLRQTAGAIEVTPDQAMLADPATTFPVTIDPGFTAYKYGWNYVDSAYPNNSYYNVSDYASVGTYDSGTTKRRSFWNMNLEPMGQYKQVLSAVFHTTETWSWSCSARAVELHRTSWVGSNVTWNTQPASNWWVGNQNVAKGYTSSCPSGDVSWDVTNAVQDNQNNGYTAITFMLKAADETDNYAWKKFDNNPRIDITYNTPPSVSNLNAVPTTGGCVSGSGRPYATSTRPTLRVTASDPDGTATSVTFEWWVTGGSLIGSTTVANVPSGSVASTTVPAGALADGKTYSWRARAYDGAAYSAFPWCEFTVDTTAPNAAPGVSSSTYPENTWTGAAGTAGSFLFAASGVADVASYNYGLDTNPPTTNISAVGPNASTWGANYKAITSGDFNGDGKRDVVVIGADGNLYRYAGDGAGHFYSGVPMWGTDGTWGNSKLITAGDFNSDGKTDIARIDTVGNLYLYPGDGAGHLGSGTPMWTTDGSWGGATGLVGGDFNGNGKDDIVAVFNGNIYMYPGDGAGHLAGRAPMWTTDGSWSGFRAFAGGDFTGDGNNDIAAIGNDNNIYLYAGDTTGHLTRVGPMWGTDGSWTFNAIVGGDFNGDSKADILASYTPGNAYLYPGNGASHLAGGQPVAATNLTITPTTDGPHVLYVQSVDRAGNLSPMTAYHLNVGGGGITSQQPGAIVAGKTTLTATTQPTVTGITYQYRRADTDAWTTIPTSDVTLATGGAVTWPLASSGKGAYPKLNWNLEATLGRVDPQSIPRDGPLQLRLTFTGTPNTASAPLKITFDRNQASTASKEVGPGTVNLLTGNYTVSATDVSIDSYGSDLTVSRSYNSRRTATSDSTGMFGPGWTSGVTVTNPDAPYTNLTVNGSLVQVGLPEGDTYAFTERNATSTGAVFDPPWEAADLSLTYTSAGDFYTLSDTAGNKTVFTHLSTAAAGTYQPTSVTAPGSAQTTTYSWEKATVDGTDVVRPTRALAPVPAGVTCTTLVAGCRALTFTYATATTATGTADTQLGDYTGRVSQVSFTAWDPDATPPAMRTIVVARYSYDNTGRLRASWDPRLDYGSGQHVVTRYSYDTDGELTTLTPAGQQPWQFGYTTLPSDPGKGRLATASRSALTAGTATTTVVYKVPTAGAGAPYDLSTLAAMSWGQSEAPTDATAIFDADQTPDGNQATGKLPSSYERATITYMNADGRTVNTATPGGYIDATWYDSYGNVVRSLSASNRQTVINSAGAVADQAAKAVTLSTTNTYSADGQRLLETLAPETDTVLPDGSTVRARTHTINTYDEGAPAGGPYDLVTTSTVGARYTNAAGAAVDADTRTTKTSYDWTLRQPTAVTTDAGGLNSTTRTTYDSTTSLVTSTTLPAGGATTNTPATHQTIYYRAGTGSGYAECDNHPEWANLACRIQPGGQSTSGPELSVTVTTYDIYNQARVVTEKVSTGVLRSTTTSYDNAGRVSTVTITDAAGLGTAVPSTRNVYDQATGQLTTVQSLDASATVIAQTSTTYDSLGRVASYTDSDGGTTSTTYDLLSRPATVTDHSATQTMHYDGGSERRGLLTSVDDSQAGTFTAAYDADGKIWRETGPSGITVDDGYNEVGAQTGVLYTQTGCGQSDCTLYADYAGYSTHGQRRWSNSTLSSQAYGYDNLGRLTIVQDTVGGQCSSRAYGFDANTNRTVLNTFNPAADGTCQMNAQSASRSWTYDTADRVNTPGYTYDALGRTTTVPAADTQTPTAGDLVVGYKTNDLVDTITQNGRTTAYTLDVGNQRIRSWTDTINGSTTTHVNHYNDDTDSPSWTTEGSTNYSRPINGIDGLGGIYDSATNTINWQISNLHGDVVATVAGTSLGLATTSETDEYGQLRDSSQVGSLRYAWLGDHERAADTAGGVVLMGVRLYNPTTGRFLSTDPIPGGNANDYDYCSGDPINCFDLNGKFAFLAVIPIIIIVAIVFLAVWYVVHPVTGSWSFPHVRLPHWSWPWHSKESRRSGKEKANDVPGWMKGARARPGESPDKAAERIFKEHHGRAPTKQERGPAGDYNKLKKYISRNRALGRPRG